MTLSRGGPRSKRNQFNVSLKEASAILLRAEAKRLKTTASTLAANLLERALVERDRDRTGKVEGLEELQAELRALRRAHYNATLKLLRQGGMSAAEVAVWVKKRME